jgi:hypothetical protein
MPSRAELEGNTDAAAYLQPRAAVCLRSRSTHRKGTIAMIFTFLANDNVYIPVTMNSAFTPRHTSFQLETCCMQHGTRVLQQKNFFKSRSISLSEFLTTAKQTREDIHDSLYFTRSNNRNLIYFKLTNPAKNTRLVFLRQRYIDTVLLLAVHLSQVIWPHNTERYHERLRRKMSIRKSQSIL